MLVFSCMYSVIGVLESLTDLGCRPYLKINIGLAVFKLCDRLKVIRTEVPP